MLKNNITQIYSGSRVIGKVKGDIFQKSIRGSVHLLRRPPAIAFDVATIEQAAAAGAVLVEVTDRETGTVYRATIQHIRECGFTFDRGFGYQIGLTLEGWTKTLRGRQLSEQLTLFEGARR